jgi:hypothetical protein
MKKYLSPGYLYKFSHLRKFDLDSARLYFEKVFNFSFVESSYTGYVVSRGRLKCPLKICPLSAVTDFFIVVVNKLYGRMEDLLMRKLYTAAELNMVFIKK